MKDGHKNWCRTCDNARWGSSRRNSNLKIRYGISLEQYNILLESQNGKCAICGSVGINARLCVDHDRITKQVRGLLCRKCNVALGGFQDSSMVLEKATVYLKRFNR